MIKLYFIYKIENKINGKHYIGSSSQERGFQTRWYEHQQNARLNTRISYNYPLSNALRKYGVENFSYEILIKDIQTPEERSLLEKQMIEEYRSLVSQHGYNQTLNTEYSFDDPLVRKKHATPVCAISIMDGTQLFFSTISEAAIKLKTDRASIHACLNGDSRHSVVKGYVIRKYDEETKTIINNNIPIQNAGRYKKIEINGEKKTFSEWCKYYNISRQSVYKRMKQHNLTIEQALSQPKRR